MKKETTAPADPLELSPSEQQAIFDDIQHSNRVRREAKLPLIDERLTYEREVKLRINMKFQQILKPYLVDAFQRVKPQTGLGGRIAMTLQARRLAEAALFADQGIANPDAARPDLMTALIRYQNGTLSSLGVT